MANQTPRTPERLLELRNDKRVRHPVRRRVALQYLGGKCVVCGTTENLQFDHIDAKSKIMTIADASQRMTEIKFWQEVDKCQLLCVEHHWDKTRRNKETSPRIEDIEFSELLRRAQARQK